MIEALLVIACVILILLPPKWDPAIRIKEKQIAKKFHHYDDCHSCLSGDICEDSTTHPNFWKKQ